MWYQCLCECKNNTIISWSIFIEELISYHDDVKNNSFFTQLINLRKNGPIIKHIQQFQNLSLRVDGIPDDKLLDLFIATLKDGPQGLSNSPRSTWGSLMERTPSHGYSKWSNSLIYTRCQIYKRSLLHLYIWSLNNLCGTNGCANARRTPSSVGPYLLKNW